MSPLSISREARMKSSIFVSAMAAAVLSLAGCVTPVARPAAPDHPLLVRAEQCMLSGDDDQALKLYRSYREGFRPSPLESECHYWEGTIHLKKGRVDDAERSFGACISNPRSHFIEAEASIGLGDCRFVSDDYSGAITSYQRALDLRVPDARNDYALYRLGVARQRLGDWDAGRSCYQLILRDMKKSPLAQRAEQRLRYPDRFMHYQVGAFQAEDGAQRLERALHAKGLIARTVNLANGPAPYLVWVGDYPTFAHAAQARDEVKKLCGDEVVLVP